MLIRPILKKTSNELLRKKKSNIDYFKFFGSKYFVLKPIDHDGKFDARSYERTFLGYFLNSRSYRVYNLKMHVVEESTNIIFKEPNNGLPRVEEDDASNDDMPLQKSQAEIMNAEGK